MAAPCGVSLHVCTIRITVLDPDTGAVADADDNSYVTGKSLSVQVTPTIEAGADITLTGGCDCVVASYRGTDKLKRFEFEINIAALEPAMISMMVGGSIINDGTYDVGVAWPSALECGEAEPAVAFEFWTDHWNGDAQDPDYPYIHHVYPQTRWQIGQQQYQNDFAQPVLTGFSRQNLAWGDGPYGDGPGADIRNGGWFYTDDTPPTAACAAATVEPSS